MDSTTTEGAPRRRYAPLPITSVAIDGGFWGERLRTNRERSIAHIYEQCKRTGRIDAFRTDWNPSEEVTRRDGRWSGTVVMFWDSDVAKWIEAASYVLATHPNPELDALLDEVIELIAARQLPDGYLNTWFTTVDPEHRFMNLRDWHELYDAGHLIEAAVAHFGATGKRSLLDVMCRYADLIGQTFGREPGQRRGYCGHPEIELALIRLAHATGERRYLDLARYFVDERGRQPHYYDQEALARGDAPETFWARSYEYNQAHLPVREQPEVVGHAVRATYLYSAMVDLAAEDGDPTLLAASDRLWKHLTTKRMYVMGGIGTSKSNEGFTSDYDLPNESAYAETCAAIALVFWAQRVLQLNCDRRYADVLELALYNAVLSGVSLDGTTFFYDNPLASDGGHHRQEWFACPCCPPNLARIFASLGAYIYAASDDELAVHLYQQSSAQLTLGGQAVTLHQQTGYPWDESVTLTVGAAKPATFGLRLRVPGWCAAPRLSVNGDPVDLAGALEQGYAVLRRTWQDGDVVQLDLPMPVARVYAHPDVRADQGRVALQRGPLIYCLEQADQSLPLHRLALPAGAELRAERAPDLLGGVVVIEAAAEALSEADWQGQLYRSAPPAAEPARLRAIPYFAWDQREPGPMTVWLPERPASA